MWAAPRFSLRSWDNVMLIDAIRLLLFPALMAFAASSDLLTMTISNRVSLILVGGFFALALATGMSLTEIGMHVGAAAGALGGFRVLSARLDRRRRRQAGGGDRFVVRLRPLCSIISSTPRCSAAA